jgi:hypothetical protein
MTTIMNKRKVLRVEEKVKSNTRTRKWAKKKKKNKKES